jgi:hypothetical protein
MSPPSSGATRFGRGGGPWDRAAGMVSLLVMLFARIEDFTPPGVNSYAIAEQCDMRSRFGSAKPNG